MTRNPRYSRYDPDRYRSRMPVFWWVHKRSYVRFVLRELTSVAVAFYALVLLLLVRALAQGPEAYAAYLAWQKTPAAIVVHLIVLVFVVFHSITWFNLAPKALVLRLGGKRVPGGVVAAFIYVAWGIVSLVMAWMIVAA